MSTVVATGQSRKAGSKICALRIGGLLLGAVLALGAASQARALETKAIDAFSQIMAVAPRAEGGFGVVGALKREAGKTPQGFLQIAADGTPIGRPVVLPSPDEQNPEASVWSLLVLPDGDYVASGWANRPNGKPNAWIIRFTPDGDIVWNILLPNESNWDQRIYSVKRLADGRLIAVGRAQAGTEARAGARGLLTVLDEATGDEVIDDAAARALGDALKCGVARCGFQDVAQLADGTLVLAGALTKADGKDDAWLLKLTPELKRIKSVSFAEADVAASVVATGAGVTVAGTVRKNPQAPAAVVVTFDRDLARKTVAALDRLAAGFNYARVLYEVPLANALLVAGESQRNATADPNAVGGLLQTQSNIASLENPAGGGPSRFRAVAVDPAGTIALVGETAEARGRPPRGLVALRREASLCQPNAQRVEEVSAALAGRAPLRHLGCARVEAPAHFKLGNGSKDVAIVVRPLIGDVDAFLLSGGQIVDASLNAGRRAELLVLPADGKPVDLTVTTSSAYAAFELSLVRPGDRPDRKADEPAGAPPSPWQGFALQMLGYDLLGQGVRSDNPNDLIDMRAVMAFQAGEGFAPTGMLDADQLKLLLQRAARANDGEARAAAASAHTIAERARPTEFKDGEALLASIAGAVHDGRIYGRGTFSFGTFEGDWLDPLDGNSKMRPRLGVLRLSDECSVSLRASSDHQLPSQDSLAGRPFAEAYLPILLEASIGVVRRGREIVAAGELRGRFGNEPGGELKEAIDAFCGVAPKEPKEEPER